MPSKDFAVPSIVQELYFCQPCATNTTPTRMREIRMLTSLKMFMKITLPINQHHGLAKVFVWW